MFGTVLYGTSALLLFASLTSTATPLKLISAKAPPVASSGPLDLLLPLGAVAAVVALASVVLGGPASTDESKPDTTPVPTPAEPVAEAPAAPAAEAPVAAAEDAPMPMPPPEE